MAFVGTTPKAEVAKPKAGRKPSLEKAKASNFKAN